MRNLRFLALLAPTLLLPVACEDPSSSSGGKFNPEAGPGFEAGTPSEAGPLPEAGADVIVPPKGVTVLIVDGLLPKKDARVLTHDASGAITADLKTDAAGKVALATAPSMVTVLTQNSGGVDPLTIAGVADGDNLVVDVTDPNLAIPTAAGSFTVAFGPAFPAATDYGVRIGNCSSSTVDPAIPLIVNVTSDCVSNQNAILATALSAGTELAYGFVKNAAKPAVGGTVNVGPVNFAAAGVTKLTASNAALSASSYGELYAIANGISFSATSTGGALDSGGLSFGTATGFADAYQSMVIEQEYLNLATHARMFVRRDATTAPASATLPNFDFTSALPSITDAALTKPTVARPEIAITSAAPLTNADGAVAVVHWFVQATEGSGRWTFILPPSTTSFKVPALPADVAQLAPEDSATIGEVAFLEASQVPGYKELKTIPMSAAGLALLEPWRPLPAAGTVRITRWTPGD